MRNLIFIVFIFLSTASFSQVTNDATTNFSTEAIIGYWRQTQTDPAFGHKSEIRFAFTKTKSFVFTYLLDNDVKEKHYGKYEIVNGHVIKLSIKNKPHQYLRIIQASPDFLKLKEKDGAEIIQLVRE